MLRTYSPTSVYGSVCPRHRYVLTYKIALLVRKHPEELRTIFNIIENQAEIAQKINIENPRNATAFPGLYSLVVF